jgi:nucleotide-diphospho-sugar transferase
MSRMKDAGFLTIANDGYVDLTRNLIQNFQQRHLDKYQLTVACLDAGAFDKLAASPRANVNLHLLSDARVPTRFCDFGNAEFAQLTREKFRAILAHLDRWPVVWYVDGDVVFRRDPLPFADESADVLLTSDASDPRAAHSRNLCTGSMVLRAGSRTGLLLDRVVSGLQLHPAWNDQRVFNECVFEEGGVADCRLYPHAQVAVLAPELFPNGHLMFSPEVSDAERPRDPVAIHANYTIGRKSKIDVLRRANCWYL